MKTKYAEIRLPYFKQGDDFSKCHDKADTIDAACGLHAAMLDSAADKLRLLQFFLSSKPEHGVTLHQADTHAILITGPEEVIDTLVSLDLVTED